MIVVADTLASGVEAPGRCRTEEQFSVRVHVGIENVLSRRDAFAALADKAGVMAFQHPDFLYPLIDILYIDPQSPVPMLVEVTSGRVPIAFAAFIRVRRRGLTILQWMGEPIIEFGDIVACPQTDHDAILEAILAAPELAIGVDLLHLRKVREAATISAPLKRAGAMLLEENEAPYCNLAAYADAGAYHGSLNARSRKSRRRARRKLEELGTLRFETVEPGQPAGELAVMALAMKREWLKEQGLASRAFIDSSLSDAIIKVCETPGSGAVLSVLSLDRRPIAIEIGFQRAQSYISYLAAMAATMKAHGPGKIQLEETLDWAFSQGMSRFELLAPADAYKRGWADRTMPVADLVKPLSLAGSVYARVFIGGVRPFVRGAFKRAPLGLRQFVAKVMLRD